MRPPTIEPRRVVPWEAEQVFAVRAALPERYRAMVDVGAGCGLRQGEVIGLAEDALDFDGDTLHVVRQIKLIRGKAVFAPPKCGKKRDVPLPASVADALRAHMDAVQAGRGHAAVASRTARRCPHGSSSRTATAGTSGAATSTAGVEARDRSGRPHPEAREGENDAAREHGMHALRHFYASALLDAGESIKAVSEYLGHSDPGLTLKVYAHLMPSSRERTRTAIATVYDKAQRPV